MIVRRLPLILAILLTAGSLAACQPADRAEGRASATEAGLASVSPTGANVVEVIARDYAFEAPDEIPSGWTTFRLKNEGREEHFILLYPLPEGVAFEDIHGLAATFQSVLDDMIAGTIDKQEAAARLGKELPKWAFSLQYMGGPGLLAPGQTAVTTVNLEPGTYVMECYVKTANGKLHNHLGMLHQLTVTETSSGASAPEADLEMTLSNGEIAIEGELTPGVHTIAVHFEEHPEGLIGNDVHLVRLEDDTDLDEVAAWMDFMEITGLRAPAPAEFLGGTHEMPVGYTAYVTVDLKPGRYAWISELPNPDEKGMLRTFTVPARSGSGN